MKSKTTYTSKQLNKYKDVARKVEETYTLLADSLEANAECQNEFTCEDGGPPPKNAAVACTASATSVGRATFASWKVKRTRSALSLDKYLPRRGLRSLEQNVLRNLLYCPMKYKLAELVEAVKIARRKSWLVKIG